MDELVTPNRLNDPVSRRLWLLSEALCCVPLDQAVELARAAEAFIVAGPMLRASVVPAEADSGTVEERRTADAAIPEPTRARASETNKPAGLLLSADQRDRLLNRLAQGATNAAIAAEFSITSRQVQGLRMGAAREIAQRRARAPAEPAEREPPAYASPEDVIRYLRQQDDVVVPQQDGVFLVNARFRLALAELVARANRMRARQGKPEFRLANGHAAARGGEYSATRHPIFWEKPAPAAAR